MANYQPYQPAPPQPQQKSHRGLKIVGGIIGGIVVIGALAQCGGGSGGSEQAPAPAVTVTAPAPTVTVTEQPEPEPSTAPAAETSGTYDEEVQRTSLELLLDDPDTEQMLCDSVDLIGMDQAVAFFQDGAGNSFDDQIVEDVFTKHCGA